MTGALDHLKSPLNLSLNKWNLEKIRRAMNRSGKNYPCSVTKVISSHIVTVNFGVNAPQTLPQITVPVLAPIHIRYPIQVGDLGMTIAADTRLGSVSGLGSGTPSTVQPGNFSGLGFQWVGNKNWQAALDANALELWHNITLDPTHLGFFATTKVVKQSVSGALSSVTDANAKAVLTSLITALKNYGLINDNTT